MDYILLLPCPRSDHYYWEDGLSSERIGIDLSYVGQGLFVRHRCRTILGLSLKSMIEYELVDRGERGVCIKRVYASRQQAIPLIDVARRGNATEVGFLLHRDTLDNDVYPQEEDSWYRTMQDSRRTRDWLENGLCSTALLNAV